MKFVWESASEYEARTTSEIRRLYNEPTRLSRLEVVAFGCWDITRGDRRKAYALLYNATGLSGPTLNWLLSRVMGGPS